MIAYLDHPQHGAHVAYNEDEVARCLADGWALRTTSAQPVVHDPEPVSYTHLTLPTSDLV